MENIRPSTFKPQRPSHPGVGRGGFGRVGFCFLLLAPLWLAAQTPPGMPPGSLIQLQVAQPAVDVSSPVTATAWFDPPVVRPGEKSYYRVSVDATESSIQWPDELPVPPGLRTGVNARGQITQMQVNSFRPLTAFVYEMQAPATGHYTVTNFTVNVSGARVEIPAASLDVAATNFGAPARRRLALEVSATNVFLGEPFRVRVMLPAGPDNAVEALREIQFNGEGLMMDKTALRQAIEPVNVNGQLIPAFVCEMIVTPIAAGPLKFSAQGFAAGREFAAPISIRGPVNLAGGPAKYELLLSDPVEIHARPLPVEGQLPGFTGAIGKFFRDPPQLSTNRLRVGEPAQLKVVFHGEGDLTRLAPPVAPPSRDWEIIADPPPGTSFILIPLTDLPRATPAIPFSYFDPETAKYVDLTIPPLPVTVIGEGLPEELPAFDEAGKAAAPIKLSALAVAPGQTAWGLKPLQLRGWFVGLQLVPVAGFLALWQWDRRRRYWEAHPDLARRVQARRALRHEKLNLQRAVAGGDAAAFVQHAVKAMSIAVAPNYPANPQALVGGDILAQLDEAARQGCAGETVKKVFAAADAQFSGGPSAPPDLPALSPGVAAVLQTLEEKL